MIFLLLANTIASLFIAVIWNRGSWLNVAFKVLWFLLTMVNAVFLYRALDAIGFFTASGL